MMYGFYGVFRKLVMSAGLILFAVLVSPTALAALDAYMTATGEYQGPITGDVTRPGQEDSMQIVAYGHNVSAGVVEGGFEPIGVRLHRPIRVTKPLDKASMPLMQAMVDGEKLTSVVIKFYRPSPSGSEVHYLTIELLNAYVVNIAQTSESLSTNPNPALETVSMSYQKIIWTWVEGQKTAEDDWVSP